MVEQFPLLALLARLGPKKIRSLCDSHGKVLSPGCWHNHPTVSSFAEMRATVGAGDGGLANADAERTLLRVRQKLEGRESGEDLQR